MMTTMITMMTMITVTLTKALGESRSRWCQKFNWGFPGQNLHLR